MIRKHVKKFLAGGLSLAMVISAFSAAPAQKAAAAKKATVKLSSTKLTLKVGKTKTLKVKKTQVKKIKSTKWSSDKKSVAAVSSKGKVTAKKEGTAKITAKVKYIPKGKKKAQSKKLTCKVTVKADGNTSDSATSSAPTKPSDSASTAPTASSNPAVSSEPTATPEAEVTETPEPAATPEPTATPVPPSNAGDSREITLSDGTKITVKDNGTIRDDVTAQWLADNEMKTGINLGNTLEATVDLDTKRSETFQSNTDRTKYDTAWGNPVTTREYIECLHSYGINTLRIPVAWSNGDIDDGTYTIDPLLLDRVEEVANWALDQGMYVVINDHWDNQWWGQFGACKFEYSEDENGEEVKTKVVDQEMRDEAWVRYERYWTQIAERFKDYSDHLIFEGANEELGGRLNDEIVITEDYKGYAKPEMATKETLTCGGNLKEDEIYEMVNMINQKFVDVIRNAGGNNASRFLLIPGYGTDISSTCDDRYKMPEDTEQNGKDRLFVSVHFYTPTEYALDEGSGDYTGEDRSMVRQELGKIKKFSDEGYAIIIGECAVCSPSDVTGNVITWYTDVFNVAARYHAVPVIWDNGVYFDREVPCINYKDVAEFLNERNGANGTTEGIERETGGGAVIVVSKDPAEYIDTEGVWDVPGIHAYMFFQTKGTYAYRDAYKPLKNLVGKKHSWDSLQQCSLTPETTVTDVNLTEDGAVYTVSFDNVGLSGNMYHMLGVSTNIDRKYVYKDLDLKATALSVKIDGKEYLTEEKIMPVKTDDQYADFMVINDYDKELPQSAYPLGSENENEVLVMPLKSIEITFRIEGIQPVLDDIASGEFVDPETGLKLNETPAE